jgi:hypothetical protein
MAVIGCITAKKTDDDDDGLSLFYRCITAKPPVIPCITGKPAKTRQNTPKMV